MDELEWQNTLLVNLGLNLNRKKKAIYTAFGRNQFNIQSPTCTPTPLPYAKNTG